MAALIKIITARGAVRPRKYTIIQRSVQSKPAKGKLGALGTTIAMGAIFLSALVPSGWILSHLEDYKHKK